MVERASSPASATAARLSPPPTTLNASLDAMACATPSVPAANGASSNTPIGPFHRTVLAPARWAPNALTVSGPMSRPSPALRDLVGCDRLGHRVGRHLLGGNDIDRQHDRDPALRRARAIAARTSSKRSGSTRLSPMPPPSAAIKRERHRSPDQHGVDVIDQRVDRRELVRHLRSAQDRDVRARRARSADARARRPRAAGAGRRPPGRPLASISSGRADTLACARCTAPNASSTYASASSASLPANAGSFASSPGSNRRFSSRTTSSAGSSRGVVIRQAS